MKILKPILGSMFAALLLVAGPANAKKVTMNIGYSVNEGHPYGTLRHLFAERFEQKSEYRGSSHLLNQLEKK
jgi:TRAP-type C4-dicarboxylate transport system substrate-binding protein